jgi:hypothetical protein
VFVLFPDCRAIALEKFTRLFVTGTRVLLYFNVNGNIYFFSFTLFIKNQEGHFFSFLTQKKEKSQALRAGV